MTPVAYIASRAAAALVVALVWVVVRRNRDGR